MTRPDSLRVFVDGRAVDVATGSTAFDAVRAFDPSAADALHAGERILTDSRGLPIGPETAIESGAIFRLVLRRERSAKAPAE